MLVLHVTGVMNRYCLPVMVDLNPEPSVRRSHVTQEPLPHLLVPGGGRRGVCGGETTAAAAVSGLGEEKLCGWHPPLYSGLYGGGFSNWGADGGGGWTEGSRDLSSVTIAVLASELMVPLVSTLWWWLLPTGLMMGLVEESPAAAAAAALSSASSSRRRWV